MSSQTTQARINTARRAVQPHSGPARPATVEGRLSRFRWLGASLIAAGWLVVLTTAVICLGRTGSSYAGALVFVVVWAVACTFPGVMIWRLLVGPSTLVRELGFGAALGIVLQLIVWAVATALHLPLLLLGWPILVGVLFALVPPWRRHWYPRRRRQDRTPVAWHLAMAAVAALSLYAVPGRLMPHPVPPERIPRDTWYNSAISQELARTLRPQDPFAVGEPLKYHWFADAHVTASAQASGANIVDAMLTWWVGPMMIVLLLAVAAAAQHFMGVPLRTPTGRGSDTRRWWVGPLAAGFVIIVPAVWQPSQPGLVRTLNGFAPSSPSGILALVLMVALAGPMLDLLRGRPDGRRPVGSVVVLTLLLACSVGTKPSLLPIIAFGALTVIVVDLVGRRRVRASMLYVIALSAALVVGASPVLAGSVGGSKLQLFGLTTLDPSYAQLLGGEPVRAAAGGWLPPAVADGIPGAIVTVAMLVVLFFLTELPRLLSWAGLAVASLRSDPGVVWGIGAGVGGCGAMWVLAHTGYGQHYFWTVSVALLTVITVTSAVRLIPADRRLRTLLVPMALMGLPALVVAAVFQRGTPVDLAASIWSVVLGRVGPYAVLIGVGGAVVALLVVLGRRIPGLRLPVLTLITAFSLAAAVPGGLVSLAKPQPTASDPSLPEVQQRYALAEHWDAARWLQRHSAPTAVVATNLFCSPINQRPPGCRVGYTYLGGLTGRRMVLGDWSFSTATQERYVQGSMSAQPPPWPERLALSLAAAESPSAEVLGQLRRGYGTRWLFLDTRATKVAKRLDRLADLAYKSEHVRIYRLRTSY